MAKKEEKGFFSSLADMIKPPTKSAEAKAPPPPPKKEDTNISRIKENQAAKKELVEYKKGGMVKKTGPAVLHKGERVLNVKQTKSYNGKKK